MNSCAVNFYKVDYKQVYVTLKCDNNYFSELHHLVHTPPTVSNNTMSCVRKSTPPMYCTSTEMGPPSHTGNYYSDSQSVLKTP